ncbi:hypothetical protein ACFQ09_11400 [Massilia norwichensis]|uniref:Response regulatory domain-containing protein n=1 Tax=Massilia norwichensis TaxID=1442366 RepID=A0ABT2AAX9_9BURK|nr:hypothetical protein [Massilia norwichensis]MCS0591356.1 hypothetical protein [Massilia norwichensis]
MRSTALQAQHFRQFQNATGIKRLFQFREGDDAQQSAETTKNANFASILESARPAPTHAVSDKSSDHEARTGPGKRFGKLQRKHGALGTLGFSVTPVFRAKKALLAAQLMPFDLIVIHTTAIPEDRRSLAGELKRCSPLSFIVLLTEPGADACSRGHPDCDSVDAILQRPLTPQALHSAMARHQDDDRPYGPALQHDRERRHRPAV